MIVTVPACSSITAGDVCLDGPWKESVLDLPLSAVNTPKRVPLAKNVPSPMSRKTDVPRTATVPEKPQTLVGCVSEKCSTCVDPAANAGGTATATASVTADRSNKRYISFLSFPPTP